MNYNKIVPAKFIERENRFVARVLLTNEEDLSSFRHSTSETRTEKDSETHPENESDIPPAKETEIRVHIKNTGRCRELLVPSATVYLDDHIDAMGSRKYRYDLIAVEKVTPERTVLINMDSQAPNKVVAEALGSGKLRLTEMDLSISNSSVSNSEGSHHSVFSIIRPETTFGSSRFDFYLETDSRSSGLGHNDSPDSLPDKEDIPLSRAFVEVKGVTLEEDGVARFPDAPTERGVKHVMELEQALAEGYEAYIIFVIQMKGIRGFEPNDVTHPEFGDALRHAKSKGVNVLAFDCEVASDTLALDRPVPVIL